MPIRYKILCVWHDFACLSWGEKKTCQNSDLPYPYSTFCQQYALRNYDFLFIIEVEVWLLLYTHLFNFKRSTILTKGETETFWNEGLFSRFTRWLPGHVFSITDWNLTRSNMAPAYLHQWWQKYHSALFHLEPGICNFNFQLTYMFGPWLIGLAYETVMTDFKIFKTCCF